MQREVGEIEKRWPPIQYSFYDRKSNNQWNDYGQLKKTHTHAHTYTIITWINENLPWSVGLRGEDAQCVALNEYLHFSFNYIEAVWSLPSSLPIFFFTMITAVRNMLARTTCDHCIALPMIKWNWLLKSRSCAQKRFHLVGILLLLVGSYKQLLSFNHN